jgi:hypothetical protein
MPSHNLNNDTKKMARAMPPPWRHHFVTIDVIATNRPRAVSVESSPRSTRKMRRDYSVKIELKFLNYSGLIHSIFQKGRGRRRQLTLE